MHRKNILIFILLNFFYLNISCYPAFVAQPVIDLLLNSQEIYKEHIYETIPYSWDTDVHVCPRLYQLVLHEIVDVIEEHDQEVKLNISNAFYLKNGQLHNEYWTLKSNLIPITEKNLHLLPYNNSTNIKMLANNYYDGKLNIEFSAGTRFVISQELENAVEVYFYNPASGSIELMSLDKTLFFQPSGDCVADFITILKSFTENNKGFVPYVWGGASNSYRLQHRYYLDPQDGGSWNYEHEDRKTKSGCDCSGLIIRAAHMACLPLVYRNTAALAQYLKHAQEEDVIENGDIIYFKGHVCIITDVEANMCIEAGSYGKGYGKIHEAHVQDLFVDISNFNELKDACLTHKEIMIYDVQKNSKKVEDVTILKLKTIFCPH